MSAGWAKPVDGLGDKVRALIEAGKLPAALNVAAVEGAAARYGAFELDEPSLAPSKAQEEIQSLIAKSDDLASSLYPLTLEVSDALITATTRRSGSPQDIAREARDVLRRLSDALELARREVANGPQRPGRPPAKHTRLILDLADIVQRANGTVDHSAKGAVALLAKAILYPDGAKGVRIGQIVQAALGWRQ